MSKEEVRIKELEKQLSAQSELIAKLMQQIEQLEKELSVYRNRKNSGNSSLPPSQDPYRVKRTESLRVSMGKKPGGQTSYRGGTLEMSPSPTEVIQHVPCYCTHCGEDLSATVSKMRHICRVGFACKQ
jgi:hypothetical protein